MKCEIRGSHGGIYDNWDVLQGNLVEQTALRSQNKILNVEAAGFSEPLIPM
jgi:hypothetical protein